MRKFDPDQPRDEHGMWASSGGGGGGSSGAGGGGPTEQHRERAAASLGDRSFVAEHADRLSRAGDEARAAYPRDERAGDVAHAAAQRAIHEEAARIHAERDAIGGDWRREEIAQIARQTERMDGGDMAAQHARAMSALADEHAAALAEREASAVGDIGDVPHAKHDAYLVARDAIRSRVATVHAELDAAHAAAAEALDRLHAIDASGNDEHPGLEHAVEHIDDLHEAFAHTSSSMADITGGTGREFHRGDAGAVGFPQREDFSSDHEYRNAVAAHENAFRQRALLAQSALERLHDKQVTAGAALRAAEAEHDKSHKEAMHEVERMDEHALVNDAVFAPHRNEDGDIVDPAIAAREDRARAASERRLAIAQDARDRAGLSGFADAIQSLRDETKSSSSAIRELSRTTGRKPRVSAKKRNRPGSAGRATVTDMARYRLKLESLKFISLVDTPAQETAELRLIKRKGSDDASTITATARLAKIGDGDNPLAYFWAFTCTGPDGKPYHDLQGDAITDDFIKAAEEFLKAGGAVDEMHDEQQTSRVAFAFPMDADIARGMFGKAIGDQIKTSGLMVAIRPAPEALAKLRSGEYTGVSIAGTGVRETLKRRLVKQAVLTSEVDGHQHAIDLDGPADEWSGGRLSTTYAFSKGAEYSHAHAWTFDAVTGAITIAADSGHTHTIDAVVPDDVRAQAALLDSGERCRSCGKMCDESCRFCPHCGAAMGSDGVPNSPMSDDESGSGPAVVVVSASISPPSGSARTVKVETKEPNTMTDRIKQLEADNARLQKMATLTDAQRAHYSKLSGSDAEAFLAKSSHERDTVLSEIAKADEVVYTSPIDGAKYRKSDDIRLIEMAKRTDEAVAKQRAAEAAEREATFGKRGDEMLSNFAKGAKKNLRGRIMKAINAEFTDATEYEEAVTALKQANAAISYLGRPIGSDGSGDGAEGSDARKRFDAKVAEIAKAKGIPTAVVLATETATNPELRELYNQAQLAGN